MKAATTIVQMIIRLTWLILLGLGAFIWTRHGQPLTAVHEAVGVVFVLALWTVAWLGLRSGATPILVGVVFLWGAIVTVFGLTQTRIMVGASHSIIQVLHLFVGIVAIGLAEALGVRIKRALKG